jgi:hypothetical protein
MVGEFLGLTVSYCSIDFVVFIDANQSLLACAPRYGRLFRLCVSDTGLYFSAEEVGFLDPKRTPLKLLVESMALAHFYEICSHWCEETRGCPSCWQGPK